MGEEKAKTLYDQVLKKYSYVLAWASTLKRRDYEVLPKSDEESQAVELQKMTTVVADEQLLEEKATWQGKEQQDEDKEEEYSCWQQLVGWVCMVLAIFAGASIGPVFKYMMAAGVTPLLASSWRNQTMVLSLLPFSFYEAWSAKENRVQWFAYKPDLPFPVFVHVLISGMSWAANLLFWVVGLQYVTTFKASIVASCHPVLLVFVMKFMGHEISIAEWIGVMVSFGGMFLSEYRVSGAEAEAVEETTPFHLQLFGYFLCFLAAAGEVVTILNRIKTRKYVPLLQYTVATSIAVMICATVLALWIEERKLFEDGRLCFEAHCLLGWMAPAWRFKMLVFGLWVGAVCITGFNYAMQYIPPLVFASVTLVDPAVTALISWIFGIEALPGIFSWLGGGVVIAGVGIIGYGERVREAARSNLRETDNATVSLEKVKVEGI
eukprot:gene3650-3996_t